MGLSTVQDIERAIEALTPQEVSELYKWLDERQPHPIDARIASDVESGLLDASIDQALEEEAKGKVRAL